MKQWLIKQLTAIKQFLAAKQPIVRKRLLAIKQFLEEKKSWVMNKLLVIKQFLAAKQPAVVKQFIAVKGPIVTKQLRTAKPHAKKMLKWLGYAVMATQLLIVALPLLNTPVAGFTLKYVLFYSFILAVNAVWFAKKIRTGIERITDRIVPFLLVGPVLVGLIWGWPLRTVFVEGIHMIMPIVIYQWVDLVDIKKEEFIKYFAWASIGACVFSVLVALGAIETDIWAAKGDFTRSAGAVDSTIGVTAFCAAAVLLYVYPQKSKKGQYLLFAMLLTALITTAFAQSRTRIVLLAGIAGLIFVFSALRAKTNFTILRTLVITVALLLVIGCVFSQTLLKILSQIIDRFKEVSITDINITYRQQESLTQLREFIQSPLFGKGWGSRSAYEKMYFHNVYTTLLMQGGLLFGGMYIVWIVSYFVKAIQNWRRNEDPVSAMVCGVMMLALLILGFTNGGMMQSSGYLTMAYIFIDDKWRRNGMQCSNQSITGAKRIGILTYHRAINYGAVMQAFSLQTRLQKDFPEDTIEIIDYNKATREWFKIKCPLVFFYRRTVKEGIQKAIQTFAFNGALKKLRLSESLLCAGDRYVNEYMSKNYDIVVVGSDAVFNWNDLGLPNPYFLGDVKGPHKLSYAASAHLQRYNNVSNEQKEYLQGALKDFQYLGVRDRNSEDFVNNLLGEQKAEHNCDPTIFLDMQFDSMQLEKKLKRHGFDFTKKTVFVMLMKPKFAEYVRKYFGEDCQIVALMDGNKCADIYLHDLNPFEWAKVFSYGSFLVTDYFHGTIMGLKNGIPVLSIDSSGYGTTGEYESKACDLLKTRLGLPEMYIPSNELMAEDGYEVFSKRIGVIENTFDAEVLKQRIEKEAEAYQSFCTALRELHK